jgi:A/G-specific adenine glycosylase
MMDQLKHNDFSFNLLQWYDQHGRHNLPWQHDRTGYRVWVSEIMLQQTQVKTVIPYFLRFIQRFPTLRELAIASLDDVFAYWSGLGYYRRARYLHQTAQIIHHDYQGQFPEDVNVLTSLPGIGASTAAAIAAQAFEQATAILEGNVKRVLSRYFLVGGELKQAAVLRELQSLANACMPQKRCADYTQAIMDLGALCCTAKQPQCTSCPLQQNCAAKKTEQVLAYPQKAIKKVLPTQKQHFLLIHHNQQRIYLVKRPAQGIWGGLWCLPCLDEHRCPQQHLHENYGLVKHSVQKFMALRHTFSHFHLNMQAWATPVEDHTLWADEENKRWFDLNTMPSLGLAKPIRQIINAFQESAS